MQHLRPTEERAREAPLCGCREELWPALVREILRVTPFHREATHRLYSLAASSLEARTPVSVTAVPPPRPGLSTE